MQRPQERSLRKPVIEVSVNILIAFEDTIRLSVHILIVSASALIASASTLIVSASTLIVWELTPKKR